MLLAIDTSSRMIGIALYDGVQVLSEELWSSKDYHTVELAPAVAQNLGRAGVKMADLQAVAVAIGPGSFTGLRIGLALAKGLALARRLALVGIPTLDILAAAQPLQNNPMLAVVRAGRGRLAVGAYKCSGNTWKPAGEIEVLDITALSERIDAPTLVCGELTFEERRLLKRKRSTVLLASPAQSLRRPSYLAELGWRRWQAGKADDPATLSPLYLQLTEKIPG